MPEVLPEPLWRPNPERIERAGITRFLRWLERERGRRIDGYEALWQWSVDDLEGFWAAIWDFCGVISHTPYERVLGEREMPHAQWFPGASVNYAEHMLAWARRPDADSRVAVVFESELRPRIEITWSRLAADTGALAATLARLQSAGLRDFYEGEVAAQIVADVAAMGGVLSAADLAGCRARFLPAVSLPWRGRTLHLSNGLTATPTFKRVAALMEAADWSGAAPGTAWHLAFAKAMQAAYAERLEGLGEAEPKGADSCTTHLTVCDQDGMMVAMTTTLLSSMGSRVVLPGSGVLMNNGVMWFDPRPGSPNAIAPGKRPLTNMSPVIVADADGTPRMALGASGGRRILASVFQMLALTAGFGMTPEEAAHFPRIDVSGPEGATADRRLPAETLAALAELGPLEVVEHAVLPVNFACPNLIAIGPDGTRQGITDVMSPWSAALAQ